MVLGSDPSYVLLRGFKHRSTPKERSGGICSRPLTRDLPFRPADRRHLYGRTANLSIPVFPPEVSHRPTLVIPTGPGFPASRCWQGPRVRFSFKENRMQFIGATGLHRKSGGAPKERSGGICSSAVHSWKCFSSKHVGCELVKPNGPTSRSRRYAAVSRRAPVGMTRGEGLRFGRSATWMDRVTVAGRDLLLPFTEP
jgi:hypothetical protein